MPAIPVIAERGGMQLRTPRPVLLVDTREQNPLGFSRFDGWFAGIERKALKLGDYSVAGMENICVVERKELSDLVHSCTTNRCVFINRLRPDGTIPASSSADYEHAEPDQNALRAFCRETESSYTVIDRRARRTAGAIPLQ